MAIEFTQLIEPQALTTELAIIIVALIFIIGYLGFRLRHAAVLFVWAIMLSVFMLVILINLDFIWFWISALAAAVTVAFAGIFRYLLNDFLN